MPISPAWSINPEWVQWLVTDGKEGEELPEDFKKIEIASFNTYCFHFNYGSPTPQELKTMLKKLALQAVCLNLSLTDDVAIPYQIRISFFSLSPQVLLLFVGCHLKRLVF